MGELTHLSLFSGIGGLDLAAEWAGIRTVGQCEWAEYPAKVLEKHWPDVPRWKDIRTITGRSFYERTGRRAVDIISGGFPCQPFSVAGKRRGREDDRYLWPEMVRVIKELRPSWVIGENVVGIVKMALPDILSELEACGYRTRAFLIPACGVGARHRRYRVAIVGHAEHNGPPSAEVGGSIKETGGRQQEGEETSIEPAGAGQPPNYGDVAYPQGGKDWRAQRQGIQPNTERDSKNVQYANSTGCKELHTSEKPDREEFHCGRCYEGDLPNTDNGSGSLRRDRELQAVAETTGSREYHGRRKEEYEPGRRGKPEPGMGGMADGVPCWVDRYWDIEPDIPRIASGVPNRAGRLRALGNAVVPQQFYPFFKAISEVEAIREN